MSTLLALAGCFPQDVVLHPDGPKPGDAGADADSATTGGEDGGGSGGSSSGGSTGTGGSSTGGSSGSSTGGSSTGGSSTGSGSSTSGDTTGGNTTGGSGSADGGVSEDAGTTGGGNGSMDGGTADSGEPAPEPPTPGCDLGGYWIGRQTTLSNALNGDQFASNWYYLQLRHEGDQVEVVDHLDCGILVKSTTGAFAAVTVQLARETMVTLATKNPQNGRTGQVAVDGGSCDIQFGRFYSVRGVDPGAYLPRGPHDDRDVAALQGDVALPSDADDAEDWNGAAQSGPGVAWLVSGGASGTRWSVQRDWTEWLADDNHPVTASDSLDRVVLGARFANEENVLQPRTGLVTVLSTPLTNDERNQVELVRIGKTAEEAASIVGIADVGDRCLAVQAELPHLEIPR